MDNEYGLLSDDEVLFVRSGRILMANPTFKVSEFLDALAQLISEQEGEWSDEREGWFTEHGQSCEVLRFGNQGWQRGRVRIRLEFCPERPPKLLRESSSARDAVSESSYGDSDYGDSGYSDSGYSDSSYSNDIFRDDVYTPRRSRENSYGQDYPRGNDAYPDEDY